MRPIIFRSLFLSRCPSSDRFVADELDKKLSLGKVETDFSFVSVLINSSYQLPWMPLLSIANGSTIEIQVQPAEKCAWLKIIWSACERSPSKSRPNPVESKPHNTNTNTDPAKSKPTKTDPIKSKPNKSDLAKSKHAKDKASKSNLTKSKSPKSEPAKSKKNTPKFAPPVVRSPAAKLMKPHSPPVVKTQSLSMAKPSSAGEIAASGGNPSDSTTSSSTSSSDDDDDDSYSKSELVEPRPTQTLAPASTIASPLRQNDDHLEPSASRPLKGDVSSSDSDSESTSESESSLSESDDDNDNDSDDDENDDGSNQNDRGLSITSKPPPKSLPPKVALPSPSMKKKKKSMIDLISVETRKQQKQKPIWGNSATISPPGTVMSSVTSSTDVDNNGDASATANTPKRSNRKRKLSEDISDINGTNGTKSTNNIKIPTKKVKKTDFSKPGSVEGLVGSAAEVDNI